MSAFFFAASGLGDLCLLLQVTLVHSLSLLHGVHRPTSTPSPIEGDVVVSRWALGPLSFGRYPGGEFRIMRQTATARCCQIIPQSGFTREQCEGIGVFHTVTHKRALPTYALKVVTVLKPVRVHVTLPSAFQHQIEP